jgi:hypothetical protein
MNCSSCFTLLSVLQSTHLHVIFTSRQIMSTGWTRFCGVTGGEHAKLVKSGDKFCTGCGQKKPALANVPSTPSSPASVVEILETPPSKVIPKPLILLSEQSRIIAKAQRQASISGPVGMKKPVNHAGSAALSYRSHGNSSPEKNLPTTWSIDLTAVLIGSSKGVMTEFIRTLCMFHFASVSTANIVSRQQKDSPTRRGS